MIVMSGAVHITPMRSAACSVTGFSFPPVALDHACETQTRKGREEPGQVVTSGRSLHGCYLAGLKAVELIFFPSKILFSPQKLGGRVTLVHYLTRSRKQPWAAMHCQTH